MIEIKEIIQSPLFAKQKKKLHKNQIKALDNAVHKILKDPEVGILKVGDMSGIRVYKFQSINEQILLAYEVVDDTLYLYTLGSHQNFYRRLKKYIRKNRC